MRFWAKPTLLEVVTGDAANQLFRVTPSLGRRGLAGIGHIILRNNLGHSRVYNHRRTHSPWKCEMTTDERERMTALCERIATEQDQQKFIELINALNDLLDEKDQRLKARSATGTAGS